MEAGFVIWDFKGVELKRERVEKFKQLLWRPRPPTLLTKEDQRRVKRNLREYSRQFEEQDALEESNASAEVVAHRQRLVEEWNAWRKASREQLEARRKETGKFKKALVRAQEAEKETEEVEEWVEEVISDQIEEV